MSQLTVFTVGSCGEGSCTVSYVRKAASCFSMDVIGLKEKPIGRIVVVFESVRTDTDRRVLSHVSPCDSLFVAPSTLSPFNPASHYGDHR